MFNKKAIHRSHQAWQTDITYLRAPHGFVYLTALLDVHTRFIVSWGLSNTLDTYSCLRVLDAGVQVYGNPELINSDQGAQFTGDLWTSRLKELGITISMSGQGRSNDNAYIERLWRTLKYEYLHMRGARTVHEYKQLLPRFIQWYNYERPHSCLHYRTPSEMLAAQVHYQANLSLISA